jgi:hypothetical protein
MGVQRMRSPRIGWRCGFGPAGAARAGVSREGEPVRWSRTMGWPGDEHAPEVRCGRINGPATVTFQVPVKLKLDRRGRLVARRAPDAAGGRGRGVGDERLEVRP